MANVGDLGFSPGDLMRRVRALERQSMEQQAGRRLENAAVGAGGLRVYGGGDITLQDGGGVIVQGGGSVRSQNFDGDMAAGNPGSDGWALGSERLALGGQLVGPVAFDTFQNTERNYPLTTTWTERISVDFTVPSWADEALVTAYAFSNGVNDSGVADFLGLRVDVETESGFELFSGNAQNAELAHVNSGNGQVLATSSLSSFHVGAFVRSFGGTWSASLSTGVLLTVNVVYRRAT